LVRRWKKRRTVGRQFLHPHLHSKATAKCSACGAKGTCPILLSRESCHSVPRNPIGSPTVHMSRSFSSIRIHLDIAPREVHSKLNTGSRSRSRSRLRRVASEPDLSCSVTVSFATVTSVSPLGPVRQPVCSSPTLLRPAVSSNGGSGTASRADITARAKPARGGGRRQRGGPDRVRQQPWWWAQRGGQVLVQAARASRGSSGTDGPSSKTGARHGVPAAAVLQAQPDVSVFAAAAGGNASATATAGAAIATAAASVEFPASAAAAVSTRAKSTVTSFSSSSSPFKACSVSSSVGVASRVSSLPVAASDDCYLDVLHDPWKVNGIDLLGPSYAISQHARVCPDFRGSAAVWQCGLCERDGIAATAPSQTWSRGGDVGLGGEGARRVEGDTENLGSDHTQHSRPRFRTTVDEKEGAIVAAADSREDEAEWPNSSCNSSSSSNSSGSSSNGHGHGHGHGHWHEHGHEHGHGQGQVCAGRVVKGKGPGQYLFMSDSGEGFTSVDVGCNGMPVVCNSRGCRPVLLNDRFRDWNGRLKSLPCWPLDGARRGGAGGDGAPGGGGEGARGAEAEAEASSGDVGRPSPSVEGSSVVVGGGGAESASIGKARAGDVRANGFEPHSSDYWWESVGADGGLAGDSSRGLGQTAAGDDDDHLRGSPSPTFLGASSPWFPPAFPGSPDVAAPHLSARSAGVAAPQPHLRVPVVVPPLVSVGRQHPEGLMAEEPAEQSSLPAFDGGGGGGGSGDGSSMGVGSGGNYAGDSMGGGSTARDILMDDRPIWAPSLKGDLNGDAAVVGGGGDGGGGSGAAPGGRKANGPAIPSHGSPFPSYRPGSAAPEQQQQQRQVFGLGRPTSPEEAGAWGVRLGERGERGEAPVNSAGERGLFPWRKRRGGDDETSEVNGRHGKSLESDGGSARIVADGRGYGEGRRREGGVGVREQVQGDAREKEREREREREREQMERFYRAALMEHPQQSLFLGNYAQFLAEGKDYERAEEAFRRAAVASRAEGGAGEAEVLVAWAKVVWEAGRDAERAMALFERAVELSPDDCFVLAAYASFLWSAESGQEPAATQVVVGGGVCLADWEDVEGQHGQQQQRGYEHLAPAQCVAQRDACLDARLCSCHATSSVPDRGYGNAAADNKPPADGPPPAPAPASRASQVQRDNKSRQVHGAQGVHTQTGLEAARPTQPHAPVHHHNAYNEAAIESTQKPHGSAHHRNACNGSAAASSPKEAVAARSVLGNGICSGAGASCGAAGGGSLTNMSHHSAWMDVV
ncbi:hypothetical protein CLOP_g12649, partial [Closterium sp. NIES-67]